MPKVDNNYSDSPFFITLTDYGFPILTFARTLFSRFSGEILPILPSVSNPLAEKSLSLGVEVAGMVRRSCATLATGEYYLVSSATQ